MWKHLIGMSIVVVRMVFCCQPTSVSNQPEPCDPPNDLSYPAIFGAAGDSGVGTGLTRPPIATCTTCSSSGITENFWQSTDFNTGDAAAENGQFNFVTVCNNFANFCTCDINGNCCQFDPATADQIVAVAAASYCSAPGSCNIYTMIGSLNFVPLVCDGVPFQGSFDTSVPFTTPGAYFNGYSYDCNSCDNIRNAKCTGPSVAV